MGQHTNDSSSTNGDSAQEGEDRSVSDRTRYDDEIDEAIDRLIDDDAAAFWVQTIAPPRHGGGCVRVPGYDRDELSYQERLHVTQLLAVDHLAMVAKHSRQSVVEVAAALAQQVNEQYDTSFDPDGDIASVPSLVEPDERNSGSGEAFR